MASQSLYNFKLDGTGRLHQRIAVVTGSSSGMGRAIALGLAQEGAWVVCADLRPEASPNGFEEDKDIPTFQVIVNHGGRAIFKKADMGKTPEVIDLIASAIKEYSKLDILVNNAGLWLPLRPFVEETDEMWDAMAAINGKGPATAMRESIKQFLKQPIDSKSGARGKIVNVSSSAGLVAIGGEATYAATKAALSMLTRNVALDHAKDAINVNAVCPGVVRTAMSSPNFRDDRIIAEMKKGTPWPRLGEPKDVANVVVFLVSDEAQWVTGINVPVDGGFTIGIPL